jgi:hypothetical protein
VTGHYQSEHIVPAARFSQQRGGGGRVYPSAEADNPAGRRLFFLFVDYPDFEKRNHRRRIAIEVSQAVAPFGLYDILSQGVEPPNICFTIF